MDRLFDELIYIVGYNLEDVAALSLALVSRRLHRIVTMCMKDRIIKHFGYLPSGKIPTVFVNRHSGGTPCVYDMSTKRQVSLGELSLQHDIRRITNAVDGQKDAFYAITMEDVLIMVDVVDLVIEVIHRDVKDVHEGLFLTKDGQLHNLYHDYQELPMVKDCQEIVHVQGWDNETRSKTAAIDIFYLTKDRRLVKYDLDYEHGHKETTVCKDVISYSDSSNIICTIDNEVIYDYEEEPPEVLPIIAKKCIYCYRFFVCITDTVTADMDGCLVYSSKLVKDIATCGIHHLAILYHDGRLETRNLRNGNRRKIDTNVISLSHSDNSEYLCYIRSPPSRSGKISSSPKE